MSFEQNARVCVKNAPDKVWRFTDKFKERADRKRYKVDFDDKLE